MRLEERFTRVADDRMIETARFENRHQSLLRNVIGDGQVDRLTQPPPLRPGTAERRFVDRAFQRVHRMAAKTARHFLGSPDFPQPPSDIGTDQHLGSYLVNRFDTIYNVANPLLVGVFALRDALHFIDAKTLCPSPFRLVGSVLGCLVSGGLSDQDPVAELAAEQLPDRHAESLSA